MMQVPQNSTSNVPITMGDPSRYSNNAGTQDEHTLNYKFPKQPSETPQNQTVEMIPMKSQMQAGTQSPDKGSQANMSMSFSPEKGCQTDEDPIVKLQKE